MMSNIGLPENRAFIADFLNFCREDGKSRKTIGCHKTALSVASKYISRPFPQVTADGWREAVAAATEERGWTRNSIWQANSAVRALCRWMYATGISEAVAVNRKPGGSGRPSKEELSDRVKFSGTEDPQQIFYVPRQAGFGDCGSRSPVGDGGRVSLSRGNERCRARGGAREMRAR